MEIVNDGGYMYHQKLCFTCFFFNSYLYNGGIGGYTKNNLSMKNMFVRKAGSAHDMSSQTFMCFEYWR